MKTPTSEAPNRRPLSLPLLVVATLALATPSLSGCSADSDKETATGGPAIGLAEQFESTYGMTLDEAPAGMGMSQETVEVYQAADTRGYVLSSDIQVVMPELIACVQDLGFTVEYDPTSEGFFGLPNVGWGVRTTPNLALTEADDLAIEACADRTVSLLETAFLNQPSSPERVQEWNSGGRREAALACIEAAGYFVATDGSMVAYMEVAKEIVDQTGDTTCLTIIMEGPGSS